MAASMLARDAVSGVIGEPQPRFGPRAVLRFAVVPPLVSAMLVTSGSQLLSCVRVVAA